MSNVDKISDPLFQSLDMVLIWQEGMVDGARADLCNRQL